MKNTLIYCSNKLDAISIINQFVKNKYDIKLYTLKDGPKLIDINHKTKIIKFRDIQTFKMNLKYLNSFDDIFVYNYKPNFIKVYDAGKIKYSIDKMGVIRLHPFDIAHSDIIEPQNALYGGYINIEKGAISTPYFYSTSLGVSSPTEMSELNSIIRRIIMGDFISTLF